MRTRFFPIAAAMALVTVFSCRKETSIEHPGGVGIGNFMATINGSQWIAADTLQGATISGGLINLTGVSADHQMLNITLNDTVPGTYRLNQKTTSIAIFGSIDSTSTYGYSTSQGADSNQAGGTVTIISIDPISHTMTGSFSFNVFRNVDGKQKSITDGIFRQIPYTDSSAAAEASKDTMTADIDGSHWAAKTIIHSTLSNILVINGAFADGSQSVSLLMPMDVKAGGPYTLDYTSQSYYGFYSPQATGGFASTSGHLTILQNDLTAKRIRGNFDFRAADPTGQISQIYQLGNGFFSVSYQ